MEAGSHRGCDSNCLTTLRKIHPCGMRRTLPIRVLAAADKLADFPRLYEVDSRYGEDVRRISLMGQHVLYDVDDQTRKVRVLAVVGQRQNPHTVR